MIFLKIKHLKMLNLRRERLFLKKYKMPGFRSDVIDYKARLLTLEYFHYENDG